MAAPNGVQWRHVALNHIKFKLLNVILAQLMDWNVIIDHNTWISVHKLSQNYI